MSKLLNREDLRKLLPPPRDPQSHKRSFGRLQIVAGSKIYPGAAVLCCLGAFKAGCGYVYLKSEAADLVVGHLPEVIPAFESSADAFVVGPGLEKQWCADFLPKLLTQIPADRPILLDGGALAEVNRFNLFIKNQVIVSPHEGEMAQILGQHWTAEKVRNNREASLQDFFARFPEWVCLLKGAQTLVASRSQTYVIPWGSVAMATAGQGDLLAGVIGAHLALGMPALQAGIVSASLCALAADSLAEPNLSQGVLAHEVAQALPKVLADLIRRPEN